MPDRFNRLKNGDFTLGAKSPRDWTWIVESGEARWSFIARSDGSGRDVAIDGTTGSSVYFTQRLRCKGEHWYRIEAEVRSACESADGDGGAVLWAGARVDGAVVSREHLVTLRRTDGFVTMRAYYRAPKGATGVDVGIGLANASGTVVVRSALFINNIEPDSVCHPLALPPPPHASPPPRRVRRVALCDGRGVDRPLTAALRARFGRSAVTVTRSAEFDAAADKSDAVIITGTKPPRGVRSVAALERLAENRLVIVSLDAFSAMIPGGLPLRVIEQPDDPLCARIVWADYMTRGFALHDAFPYAWTTDDPRVFVQRQFRKSASLKNLCKERGYVVVLASKTDLDETSDQPICLYKAAGKGGVIVADLDAVEAPATSHDEINAAGYMLFNLLGVDQSGLGQYAMPIDTEHEWCELLKEFSQRYPAAKLTGTDRHDMVMEVGGTTESFGLPMVERPLLLLRSGLRGDDLAGVYGCLWFVKQLVRPQPHENAYARALLARFRLAWIPLCAPWQPRGWDAAMARRTPRLTGTFDDGSIAAVIDITSGKSDTPGVLFNRADATHERVRDWLPGLSAAFVDGRRCIHWGNECHNVTSMTDGRWRMEPAIPRITVSPDAFDTQLHRSAEAAGAELVRIEIPGDVSNFACNSIRRTDLVAAMIEYLIGLFYGTIAVNRTAAAVRFEDHPPLAPGQAVVVPIDDAERRRTTKRVG